MTYQTIIDLLQGLAIFALTLACIFNSRAIRNLARRWRNES